MSTPGGPAEAGAGDHVNVGFDSGGGGATGTGAGPVWTGVSILPVGAGGGPVSGNVGSAGIVDGVTAGGGGTGCPVVFAAPHPYHRHTGPPPKP
jgi:hypothetical protein